MSVGMLGDTTYMDWDEKWQEQCFFTAGNTSEYTVFPHMKGPSLNNTRVLIIPAHLCTVTFGLMYCDL